MPHRFCIVSDLDHTMVDHQDPKFESLLEFNRIWSSKFRHDSYLVFSTGRSHVAYENLRKEAPLLTPDLLICSVGTEIYVKTETGDEVDAEWNAELDKGWNRDKIVSTVKSDFDKLHPQNDSEQRPHKVSYHLKDDSVDKKAYVQQLRDKLQGAGVKVKVVYSGGIDVDVLPECASKGLALQFLQVCTHTARPAVLAVIAEVSRFHRSAHNYSDASQDCMHCLTTGRKGYELARRRMTGQVNP